MLTRFQKLLSFSFLVLLFSTNILYAQYTFSSVTNTNREHPEMYGGWGPHLRSILRANDGSNWMAIDGGPDVYNNDLITYYKFDEAQNVWIEKGNQNIASYGIQQNMSHMMVGNEIVSYGVNIYGSKRILQTTFDVSTEIKSATLLPIILDAQGGYPNYIGSAVNKENGLQVVWCHLALNTPPAKFLITWKYPDQSQWNGPVILNELVSGNAYNMFLYVYGTFTGNDTLDLVAQSGYFNIPGVTDTYLPAHITLNFTPTVVTPSQFKWLGPNGSAANYVTDIWANPCNDDLHTMTYSFSGETIYYYRSSSPGSDWEKKVHLPLNYDAKLSYDVVTDTLALVSHSVDDIYLYKWKVNDLNADLDINTAVKDTISIAHLGTNGASTLYVQRSAMQENETTRFQFGLVGSFPTYDHILQHVKETDTNLLDDVDNSCSNVLSNDGYINEQNNITLYPNPTAESIRLDNIEGYNKVSVFDVSGKLILKQKITENNEVIDISNLTKGLYYLMLTSGSGKSVRKSSFIKK